MKKTCYKTVFVIFVIVLFVQCNKGKDNVYNASQEQLLPRDTAQTIPVPDHIVIVIEENHAYEQIIGSDSALYINTLANDTSSVSFTQSYAISYGSQPNYLALFSGSTQGSKQWTTSAQ